MLAGPNVDRSFYGEKLAKNIEEKEAFIAGEMIVLRQHLGGGKLPVEAQKMLQDVLFRVFEKGHKTALSELKALLRAMPEEHIPA